jgi:hypothetical protein
VKPPSGTDPFPSFLFQVAADGKTIRGTSTVGEVSYEWDLTAERE